MYENNILLDCGIARDLPETNLLNTFLQDCQVRNFSPRTIQSYKSNLKYFLSRHSVQISPEVLKSFLVHIRDEKGYSPSTVENYFAAMSSFYDFLEWEVKEGISPAISFVDTVFLFTFLLILMALFYTLVLKAIIKPRKR